MYFGSTILSIDYKTFHLSLSTNLNPQIDKKNIAVFILYLDGNNVYVQFTNSDM